MYIVEYSKAADMTLRKWKKSNPMLFKKATKVLVDIMQHPRSGIGHPEALVGATTSLGRAISLPTTVSFTTSTTSA